MRRATLLHVDEVLWQNDLALLRSIDGSIPWNLRFGQGRVKVLSYDLDTQAGTFLFHWPASYDPLGEHAHGGNHELYVLEGALRWGGKVLGPGTYLYASKGEKHGPYTAGPEGCLFLVSVDGPLFDQSFLAELVAQGKAPRHRA